MNSSTKPVASLALVLALASAALLASPRTSGAEETAEAAAVAAAEEQKKMLDALDAALARYDRLINQVTDPAIRADNRAFSDAYKDRRGALRKAFDQTKYDDLRDELNIAHQRLASWLAPLRLPPRAAGAKQNTPRRRRVRE